MVIKNVQEAVYTSVFWPVIDGFDGNRGKINRGSFFIRIGTRYRASQASLNPIMPERK